MRGETDEKIRFGFARSDLLIALALWAKDPLWTRTTKARAGIDYPIKIHISGIHIRADWIEPREGASLCTIVTANAILSGQKIELTGDCFPGHYLLHLVPGDYQARLLKDPHKMEGTPLYQEYEVVLPDRTVWRSTVTGISE